LKPPQTLIAFIPLWSKDLIQVFTKSTRLPEIPAALLFDSYLGFGKEKINYRE